MLQAIKDIKYSPLSAEQRILRLERLYDGSLDWLDESLEERNPKGTGAATLILERARAEVSELKRAGQGSTQQKIELTFKCGCDKCEEKPDDSA